MQFKMKLGYEHPGLGDDRSPDPYAAAKIAIAQWTGDMLNRVYPGHAWHCEVLIQRGTGAHAGGVIKIRLNGIMPPDRWYVVNLADVMTDPGGKRTVLKGAGEILERYSIPRGRFDIDHWRQALNAMPVSAKTRGKGHLEPLIA
jgi:hypothetical protein